MNEMTLKEASERWGVKVNTIRQRLFQDQKRGHGLKGCHKVGRDWVVTERYMHSKQWVKRNV